MTKRWLALLLSAFVLTGCASGGLDSSGSGSDGQSSGSAISPPDCSSSEAEWDESSGVLVDWSRLKDRQSRQPDVDGGRWYPDRTDVLIPGRNYGPLIPYIGDQAYMFNRWEYAGEVQEYWSDWPNSFYGLMTRDGEIVVDPVYQSVGYCAYGKEGSLPVLLLSKSGPAWEEFGNGSRYAVAASDGSWITDFEFINYTNRGNQLFLLRPEGCTALDSTTGEREDWSWEELGVSEEDLPETLSFLQWVTGLTWLDQGVYLGQKDETGSGVNWEEAQARVFQPETGQVYWIEQGQWDQWCKEDADRRWREPEVVTGQDGQMVITVDGQSYPLEDTGSDFWLYVLRGDFAIVNPQDGEVEYLYRLSSGERILEGKSLHLITDLFRPEVVLPAAYEQGVWTVYNDHMESLFALHSTRQDQWIRFSLQDGLLSLHDDSTFFGCYDLDQGEYVFFRNLGLGD